MSKQPTIPILPDSFKMARKNFGKNLQKLIDRFDYTAAILALKLNTICESDSIATKDVYEWLSGDSLPKLYHLYKLSLWFSIPMDRLFANNFEAAAVQGHSFAKQEITKPITATDVKVVIDNNREKDFSFQSEDTINMTKTNIVSIAKTTKKQMTEVVTARTNSTKYNLLLANKIYSSEMQLKDIAKKVGASTRSLRDYAFYGTTVPTNVAERMVKLFKTSYRNLGLSLNEDTNRYEHMTIKIKA
jgi:hypothetical protein